MIDKIVTTSAILTMALYANTSWSEIVNETTITYKEAKAVEQGDFDPLNDELLASGNPKIKFRLAKSSPYRTECVSCAESYEACWQEEKDKEHYLGDPCVGHWQGCVLDKKASCTIWEAK